MSVRRSVVRRVLVVGIVLAPALGLITPNAAHAQALWLDRSRPSTLQLEIVKPDFAGKDNLTFATSVWYVSGRTEFSELLHGVAELPFATSGVSPNPLGAFDQTSGLIAGNPYVGLEMGQASATVLVELGIRLPLAAEENEVSTIVGLYSDTERWSAWIPNALIARMGARVRSRPNPQGLWFEGRIMPEIWLATEPSLFDEADLWAVYGGAIRLDRPAVRAGAGLSGRVLIDNVDQGFGAVSFHLLDLAADFGGGRLRPGVSLRVPVDEDLNRALALVYGLSLSYAP